MLDEHGRFRREGAVGSKGEGFCAQLKRELAKVERGGVGDDGRAGWRRVLFGVPFQPRIPEPSPFAQWRYS